MKFTHTVKAEPKTLKIEAVKNKHGKEDKKASLFYKSLHKNVKVLQVMSFKYAHIKHLKYLIAVTKIGDLTLYISTLQIDWSDKMMRNGFNNSNTYEP